MRSQLQQCEDVALIRVSLREFSAPLYTAYFALWIIDYEVVKDCYSTLLFSLNITVSPWNAGSFFDQSPGWSCS